MKKPKNILALLLLMSFIPLNYLIGSSCSYDYKKKGVDTLEVQNKSDYTASLSFLGIGTSNWLSPTKTSSIYGSGFAKEGDSFQIIVAAANGSPIFVYDPPLPGKVIYDQDIIFHDERLPKDLTVFFTYKEGKKAEAILFNY